MAFVTKTWKDRLVEYAGRRRLKNVATGEEILMDVSRSEGTVNQAGDAFSAANMNNLEQRIKTEFDSVNSSLVANGSQLYMDYHDGKYGVNTDPKRGADTFIPFRSISSIKVQTKLIQTSKSWYDWTVNLVIDDVVVASYTHSIGTHAVYTNYSPDGGSVTVGNVINPGTMINYMQK